MHNGNMALYTFGTSNVAGQFQDSKESLTNYYKQYDIKTYHHDENSSKLMGETFKLMTEENVGGIRMEPWWAAVTSRMCLLIEFLESDHDWFIMQDLDYLVIRPDLNIREYLDETVDFTGNFWNVNYWTYRNQDWFDKDQEKYYCQKYHNCRMLAAKDGHLPEHINMKDHSVLCADMMIISRKEVEKIVKFYEDRNCYFSDAKSFNHYTKETIYRTQCIFPDAKSIQEEEFLAAYCLAEKVKPLFLNDVKGPEDTWLKRDFWQIRESETNGFTKFSFSVVCDFISSVARWKNLVFAHMGHCERDNFFTPLSKTFKC